MNRVIAIKFILCAVLVLYPGTESQWVPRQPGLPINPTPLCASQYALAQHACAALPFTPLPPPTHPSSSSPSDGSSRRHRHNHGHRHGHTRDGHKEAHGERDCCRWLRELDNVCVCDLLVNLAPFLSRPVHNYTVIVDESCHVTFQCGSGSVRV
ncbi:unnamed protein product [Fraxinus pennsylvanica]|uniref:Bifunctional inhibitor/plant lipid transfer protein/seed storage helical domain-containing protein n=1 Tax=Fraxinus pennsylvanica TaxID=56036 RepID=A0AAD2AGE6_9LAMI|nr:unnamed protein product [Fraxinus pennsylvanica]